MTRAIAIFDFDGTLVGGDSLPGFVACCVGWPRTAITALIAALVTVGAKPDRRTAFKKLWLKLALKGLPLGRLPAILDKLDKRLFWLPTRARLDWHKGRGDMIVIASGGLDLYLPHILRAYKPDHIICTPMDSANGKLTGTFTGGNCVRQEKARRVGELLASLPRHEEVWAYGNLPHDLPLLQLATHRVIV